MNPFKVLSGFVVLMLGLSLLFLSSNQTAEYGAVVIIGPLPIVLASNPDIAIFMVLFAIMLILLPLLLLWRW